MAKSKYIITFFLFLAAFLFIGESCSYFLENFQNSYVQVGYYLATGDSEKQMNRDISKQADAFHTAVFAMEKSEHGAFSRDITIYGDSGIENTLKKAWNIEPGTVSSFFSGTTTFAFEPFENAGEKAMENCWYPGGTQEQLQNMLHPGMEPYSGAFRNEPAGSTAGAVAAATWLVVLLAVLLLTAYDLSYGRKEQSIRVILGADNNNLRWRKIWSDVLGLSISYAAAFLILMPFTAPEFQMKVSLLCFAAILAANSFLAAWGMRMKVRTPRRGLLSNKILGLSMGLKGGVAVLTVLVLSVTIGLAVEGVKLYAQKGYYAGRQEYAHVDIAYPYAYEKMERASGVSSDLPPLDTPSQVKENFLRYSYRELDCSLLYSESYEAVAPNYGEKYVYANLRGLEAYKEYIPRWDYLCSHEGNYILVSEQENQEAVRMETLSFGNVIGLLEANLNGVVVYKNGLSISAEGRRDGEFDYTYRTRNPVVLLDTYDYGKLPALPARYSLREPEPVQGVLYKRAPFFMQFVSVRDDPARIGAFADTCGGEAIHPKLMEFSIVNVGQWFDGLWSLQNRSLLIAVILEIQIASLVLRIIYEEKAKELILKKVLGFSMPERYRGFFALTGIICGLVFLAACVISLIFHIGVVWYFIYGSVLLWLLDWTVLALLAHKNDKTQIQRVLKGGI